MKDMKFDTKAASFFVRRYHLVMFIVLVVIILSIAILLLYQIVNSTGALTEDTSTESINFDQATIDRINQLKTSDQPSEPLNFSGGRISPFNE